VTSRRVALKGSVTPAGQWEEGVLLLWREKGDPVKRYGVLKVKTGT